MLPTRDPLQTYRHIQTESKRMERDIPCEWKVKESHTVAILISDKIDFKINNIISDKEGHYIMINGSSQEEDIITIVNIYAHNISSVAQSCPTLCDPMNPSMPGLPVHHQLPEFTQTHVH